MRTTEITMSDPALSQLAGMMKLRGKWFLPEQAGGPDEFIRARKEWEERGLARLDFDGSLHPSPRFARMLYNLTHTDRALLYENGEEKTLFLKGPVDILMLKRREGEREWKLALRPFHEVSRWILELADRSFSGRILFLGEAGREPDCRVLDPEGKENRERREFLGNCLQTFYLGQQENGVLTVGKNEKEGEEHA